GVEVVVPRDMRRTHPVVRSIQRDARITQLTSRVRSRALRLLQGLLAEADRRGHSAVVPAKASSHYVREVDRPLIVIWVNGHGVGLGIRQEQDRVPRQATATELRRAERDSWYRVPAYDKKPSERLTMFITEGLEYKQS